MKTIFKIMLLISLLCTLSISALAFSDVTEADWFSADVDYVINEGLFNGTGEDIFSPYETMTRGMFITVLGRMADVSSEVSFDGVVTKSDVNVRSEPNTDSPVVDVLDTGYTLKIIGISGDWYNVKFGNYTGYIRNDLMEMSDKLFSDVDYTAYYAPYILWANKYGIATGTSETTFSPDLPVTREAICILLSRYSTYASVDVPVVNEKATFADDASISDTDAVYALQQAGVINGRSDGSFSPKDSATRAEVATIFHRFGTMKHPEPEPEPPLVVEPTAPVEPEVPTPTVTEQPSPDIDDYTGYELYASTPPQVLSVGTDYFNDACFIGHSLVVGMKNYFSLPNADYHAVSGISARTLLTYDRFPLEATTTDDEGNELATIGTISDVLSEQNYGKIYIMLGINEIGPQEDHANMYYTAMASLVDIVRQTQPNAKVYLIGITPVTQELSQTSVNITRDNILVFNNKLQAVAVDKGVYYIDAFGLFADSMGHMPTSGATSDGFHLAVGQYEVLKNYIMTHVG